MTADRPSLAMTVLVAVLLVAAMSPVILVEVPAMLDYVNHLARMELLAGDEPPVAYDVVWGLYPNLAMDLIVPALGRLIGVAVAAKVFLAVSQLLVVTGAMAIEWAVARRQKLSGLGAMLVLFSLPLAWGLMNFAFGLGLAAWAIAAWIELRGRGPLLRFLVHFAFVVAIFVSHFFALGIYGLTIGLIELAALSKAPMKPKALAGLVAMMASPPLVLLGAMLVVGGRIGDAAIDWDFGEKLFWPLLFMNVYNVALGLLTLGVLIVLAVVLAFGRCLKIAPTGLWILAGLVIAYIVLPRRLFGVAYVDIRLVTAAFLILPAFLTFTPPKGMWRHAPLIAVVCLIVLNNTSVARAWVIHQFDYRQMRASFPALEAGSAVLVTRWDGPAGNAMDNQPLNYAPTLAAPEAGVFVSSLYTARGMQPLQAAAPYRPIEAREALDYLPGHVADLKAALATGATPPAHLADWPRKYQYLYVLGTPQPNPMPARLRELSSGRRYVLYAITP